MYILNKYFRLKIEDHSETSNKIETENETSSKIETQSKACTKIEPQLKLPPKEIISKIPMHKMIKPPQQKYKSVLIPIQSTSSYIGPYYTIERLPIELAEKFEKNTKMTHTDSDDHVIDLNDSQYCETVTKKKLNLDLPKLEVVDEKFTEIFTDPHDFEEFIIKEDDDEDEDFDPSNPYEFMKYWQAIKYDASLYKHEKLLRLMVNEGCDIPAGISFIQYLCISLNSK